MKNHSVTIKLSDDEFKKLQQSARLEGTTVSQYIRERINRIEPTNGRDIEIAASKICEIYIELSKRGFDDNENVMEGMDRLCQILY